MNDLRLQIYSDPALALPEWAQLEQGRGHTPYQRSGWVLPWFAHAAPAEGLRPFVVVIRDADDAALALLPLCEGRIGPARALRFAGGKHANFHMGLFADAAPARLAQAGAGWLPDTLARAGIDLLLFENQPEAWQGFPNPFAALPRAPSPEPAWKFALDSAFDALLATKLSKDARHKLRRKERRLGDLGPVTFSRADSVEDVDATLAAFHAQKAARFALLGQPNVFADEGIRAFVREASLSGLTEGMPAIELHRCMVGERIVATYGAAVSRGRFCGMFTSFDGGADVVRWSPGDLLLVHLIEAMCRRGIATFDLGVGDANYKETYCDAEEALFESIVPLSLRGRVAAFAVQAARSAKRHVKQSPQALALVNRLRRARA